MQSLCEVTDNTCFKAAPCIVVCDFHYIHSQEVYHTLMLSGILTFLEMLLS